MERGGVAGGHEHTSHLLLGEVRERTIGYFEEESSIRWDQIGPNKSVRHG